MEYNILIVEDDETQRRNLVLMLQELSYKLNIYEAGTIEAGLSILGDIDMDLFYLDHNLPDGSGIDFGRQIRAINKYRFTWVVFLTGHVEYMLAAFKQIHCYDYIIKPYNKEEVKKLTRDLIEGTQKNKMNPSLNDRIRIDFIMNGIRMNLYTDQIYFVEVDFRNCLIHTKAGVYTAEKTTLNTMISKFPKDIFFQSHRAFLINTVYISNIFQHKGSWVISFQDYDKTALIGKTYKRQLFELIKDGHINIFGS